MAREGFITGRQVSVRVPVGTGRGFSARVSGRKPTFAQTAVLVRSNAPGGPNRPDPCQGALVRSESGCREQGGVARSAVRWFAPHLVPAGVGTRGCQPPSNRTKVTRHCRARASQPCGVYGAGARRWPCAAVTHGST